jgi:hypothetical protein
MLIREGITGDILDYAIALGAYDAAEGRAMRDNFFRIPVHPSQEARFLYELSYDLERESHIIADTSKYSVDAFVRKYDDCHGMGLLETVLNGKSKYFEFSYHVVEQDARLEPGEVVSIVYFLNSDHDLQVESVKPKTYRPLYDQR